MLFGGVFQKHRAALAVGDEEAPGRCVGDAHFLGHDITLEERALMAAIFLRPCHAEPALGADLAGEFRHVGVFAVRLVRIESAGGDFLGEKGAHFLAQLFAFGRQADRIETEGCGHGMISTSRQANGCESARGDQRPQFVGAAVRDQLAELDGPVALGAEIVAPRQCAQRITMQDVARW